MGQNFGDGAGDLNFWCMGDPEMGIFSLTRGFETLDAHRQGRHESFNNPQIPRETDRQN